MRTRAAALGLSILAALATAAVVVKKRARPDAQVVVGPRLARLGDGLVAVWVEYPKTLVVAAVARGALGPRVELRLAGEDADVEQVVPFSLPGEVLAVAILERGVRRAGLDAPLRRLSVRALDGGDGRATTIVEAAEGSEDAPAAVIAAGAYGTAKVPAIVWRRQPAEGGSELRLGPAMLSVVREGGRVTSSEITGQGRSATAAAFRPDGVVVVGGFDAGRPFVTGPDGELGLDVPTPAVIAGLAAGSDAPQSWTAAGLDGTGRLFVVGGSARTAQLRGLLPEGALVEPQPDLADAGKTIAPPLLLERPGGGALLVWAAAGKQDELRVRALAADGAAERPSRAALACPRGARLHSWDAAIDPAGGATAAALCVKGGRGSLVVGSF